MCYILKRAGPRAKHTKICDSRTLVVHIRLTFDLCSVQGHFGGHSMHLCQNGLSLENGWS